LVLMDIGPNVLHLKEADFVKEKKLIFMQEYSESNYDYLSEREINFLSSDGYEFNNDFTSTSHFTFMMDPSIQSYFM